MALDAHDRSTLYQKFVPLLGDEAANTLMSEFPASEADELVTNQFLRAELAVTRGELRAEMGDLGTALRGEMHELGNDLRGEMHELGRGLRADMSDLRTELRAETSDLRTELRAEIHQLGDRTGQLEIGLAHLETKFERQMRRQTAWLASAIMASTGLTLSVSVALA